MLYVEQFISQGLYDRSIHPICLTGAVVRLSIEPQDIVERSHRGQGIRRRPGNPAISIDLGYSHMRP
jgi:hypothetical protein